MSTVAQWVRLALTGNPESTSPADSIITMLQTGVLADLMRRYPDCLEADPDDMTEETDQEAYKEAAGYAIAAKIVSLPGGGQFAQYVMSVKVQATTTTLQNPAQTAAEAQEALSSASDDALFRIECVRAAMAQIEPPPMLALAGRRRTLTRNCGCP